MLYEGCHDAVYLYEGVAGGDACEPETEQDFFMLVIRVFLRHRFDIMNYKDERLLISECYEEFGDETESMLRRAAYKWRMSHSSPIVKNGMGYIPSPSVEKALGVQKETNETKLWLPSQFISFDACFLSAKEIESLEGGDKIDYCLENGLFVGCTVSGFYVEESTDKEFMILKQIGVESEESFYQNIDNDDIDTAKCIAKYQTISLRTSVVFEKLVYKQSVFVCVESDQWKPATVVMKDASSYQYLCEFLNDDNDDNLGDLKCDQRWFHIDDDRFKLE